MDLKELKKIDENGLPFDLKTMYKVTINGQSYLLMLAKMLAEVNIKCMSANTDGIVSKVSKDKDEANNPWIDKAHYDYHKARAKNLKQDWMEYAKKEQAMGIKQQLDNMMAERSIKHKVLTSEQFSNTIKNMFRDFTYNIIINKKVYLEFRHEGRDMTLCCLSYGTTISHQKLSIGLAIKNPIDKHSKELSRDIALGKAEKTPIIEEYISERYAKDYGVLKSILISAKREVIENLTYNKEERKWNFGKLQPKQRR